MTSFDKEEKVAWIHYHNEKWIHIWNTHEVNNQKYIAAGWNYWKWSEEDLCFTGRDLDKLFSIKSAPSWIINKCNFDVLSYNL